MPSSYFEGAKGFSVRSMNVDNVDGNYTDLRHTSIQETEADREFYDQAGAVGVVNGRGRLTGTINHGGDPQATNARKGRPTQTRSQTAPAPFNAEETRRRAPPRQNRNSPGSRASRPDEPGSDSTFFKNAESFDVDSMAIRNTSGDFVDQRTTEVRKDYARERRYDQRGAVGVVNGQGLLSGTINYGPQTRKSTASKQESSSDEEESESEESSEDDDPRAGRGPHYNQRGAVGVVNDRGRLSGTINYNTVPQKQRPKERGRKDNRHAPGVDAGGHQPSGAYSDFASVYEEPRIRVEPCSPPQNVGYGAPGSRNPFEQPYNRGSVRSPYDGTQAPHSNEHPQQWTYGHSTWHDEQQARTKDPNYLGAQGLQPNQPLSPLGLGLQTPPPTPGMASQYGIPHTYQNGPDARGYVDKNPFRRMTAPAGYDVSGLASQMDRMSMQSSYASPPLTGYRSPGEGAPQYL